MKKTAITFSLLALGFVSLPEKNVRPSDNYRSSIVRQRQALGLGQGVSQTEKPQVALKELPENVLNAELKALGGKKLKLSAYSGKVMVINLFATWCGPCRMESPMLANLQKEFGERGVVVIELSTENPDESKDAVREWVWNFRLPYTVGWATPEVAATLMQGRSAIPQAYVIGRDGRIRKRFIGFSPTTTMDFMRNAIEEALE